MNNDRTYAHTYINTMPSVQCFQNLSFPSFCLGATKLFIPRYCVVVPDNNRVLIALHCDSMDSIASAILPAKFTTTSSFLPLPSAASSLEETARKEPTICSITLPSSSKNGPPTPQLLLSITWGTQLPDRGEGKPDVMPDVIPEKQKEPGDVPTNVSSALLLLVVG